MSYIKRLSVQTDTNYPLNPASPHFFEFSPWGTPCTRLRYWRRLLNVLTYSCAHLQTSPLPIHSPASCIRWFEKMNADQLMSTAATTKFFQCSTSPTVAWCRDGSKKWHTSPGCTANAPVELHCRRSLSLSLSLSPCMYMQSYV